MNLTDAKKKLEADEKEAHAADIRLRNTLVLSVHPYSLFCTLCDAFCEGKTLEESLALAAKRRWEEPVPGKLVCRDCSGTRYMEDDYEWRQVCAEDKRQAYASAAGQKAAAAAEAAKELPKSVWAEFWERWGHK